MQKAKEPYHQAPNVYLWFLKLAKIVIHFKNIFFRFHYQLVKIWFFQKQYVKSQLFFFMCWKLISNFWMKVFHLLEIEYFVILSENLNYTKVVFWKLSSVLVDGILDNIIEHLWCLVSFKFIHKVQVLVQIYLVNI